MGYTRATLKGLSWMTLLRGVTRMFTFVRLAILGRLLTPVQFGYFAIATLILSLLEIITETGINVFLVQYSGNIKDYINSAWCVSILRGVLLSIFIIITSLPIANFFNAPDAYNVILLMAFVPFIRGFINPAIVTYQKDLLFYKEFQLRSILFFVDMVISILFAFYTRSATSFVWGLIASAVLEVGLSFVLIPLWPRLVFEYKKVKHVIQRGWWVTLTVLFSYFADNSDTIIVGKFLGPALLGIYQVAYKFSTLPISEITNVVNQVVFPVYAKFPNERERLWRAFVKVTISSSLGAFILGGVVMLLANPLINIFMGEQWIAAIPVIYILAVYGILRTIFGSFSALFLAVGKQSYVAQMTFCRVAGLMLTIIPFVIHYGMIGAGFAMLFSVIVEIPIILYFTYTLFNKVLTNENRNIS